MALRDTNAQSTGKISNSAVQNRDFQTIKSVTILNFYIQWRNLPRVVEEKKRNVSLKFMLLKLPLKVVVALHAQIFLQNGPNFGTRYLRNYWEFSKFFFNMATNFIVFYKISYLLYKYNFEDITSRLCLYCLHFSDNGS